MKNALKQELPTTTYITLTSYDWSTGTEQTLKTLEF